MKCPFCFFLENKVVNSRLVEDGSSVRRRRQCLRCKKRWTTYETIKEIQLIVVKRDKRRELFDKNKVLAGIRKACEKRPIPTEKIQEIVDAIERECRNKFGKEISSQEIGQMVMNKLKKLDDVAYVRFASVYKNFQDVSSFVKEARSIKKAIAKK